MNTLIELADAYARNCFSDGVHDIGIEHPHTEKARAALVAGIESLQAEVERLTACLAKANSNHEEFERKWYLACDELDALKGAEPVAYGDAARRRGKQVGSLWHFDDLGLSMFVGEVIGQCRAAPQAPALKPLTVEAYTAIAHRTASKYAHRSDPAHVVYTFFPHTLDDFVRKIEAAAHGITETQG